MYNMISRRITNLIKKRLVRSPAAAIIGPRQSGKTTLAKTLSSCYFDMENPQMYASLDAQWPELIKQDQLIILDEAQSYPVIFSRLRSAIDQDRQRTGRFLLLGSVSPALMKNVSESLAGRLAVIELTPFLLDETGTQKSDELWFYGGYPEGGVLDRTFYPSWQNDYIGTLTQRDLPNWGLSAKPAAAMRLLHMLSVAHAQNWNASKIGQSLGIDYKTVNGYMDYLTGSFIVRQLEPYFANLKKRLIKSPKMYLRDSGLLHSLLKLPDFNGLLSHPSAGASWEGFVIEQILGKLSYLDRQFSPYYLRTSDQKEIDLILDFGPKKWAIEIKLTSSPSPDDIAHFNKVADLIDADKRILVCRIEKPILSETCLVSDLPYLLSVLEQQS
ncbi:MAG: ATP-binding protein [Planctomycetes bacterium]|nr:ATP-binding protein [Planctomycetota bacterium]